MTLNDGRNLESSVICVLAVVKAKKCDRLQFGSGWRQLQDLQPVAYVMPEAKYFFGNSRRTHLYLPFSTERNVTKPKLKADKFSDFHVLKYWKTIKIIII
uniref:Uncharacterized protein n=1 Tax=Romanomermis culicivorax TaxID=13658 RepID=A0A915KH36_ROMCU